jgi:exodeoxyribonuclease V beta subunit
MNYSFISQKHEATLKNNSNEIMDPYDKFIFKDLLKGALTGNMLHYIFEFADFTKPESWSNLIKKTLLRFMSKKETVYNEDLLQLIKHPIRFQQLILMQDLV